MHDTDTRIPEKLTAATQAPTVVLPIAVTFAEARRISGLGLTTLWRLARERRIEVVRIGRRTLITYRSLAGLLLPSTDTPHPDSGQREKGS
jgi:hypothetical protein